MTPEPTPRAFEMELDLDATPDQVWKALTEAPELMRWFPVEARVQPGEGGSMHWSWGGHYEWPHTIEVWEPGQRLRTRYDSPVEEDGSKVPLFCDFQIEGRGGTTRLRMVHSGFGPQSDFDQEFDGISRGWPVELRSLKHYLENHLGQDRHVAWATHGADLELDQLWARLIGPGGMDCGGGIAELEVGQPFELALPDGAGGELGGEVLRGHALTCQPREFSGVVDSHGKAFLRICVEDCGGNPQAWLWMAFYGDAKGERERHQKAFESILASTFSDRVVETR